MAAKSHRNHAKPCQIVPKLPFAVEAYHDRLTPAQERAVAALENRDGLSFGLFSLASRLAGGPAVPTPGEKGRNGAGAEPTPSRHARPAGSRKRAFVSFSFSNRHNPSTKFHADSKRFSFPVRQDGLPSAVSWCS